MNRHASSELLQNLRVYQSYYQHPSPFCPVGKLYRVHEIHEVMWCATVIMGGVRHQNNHNNIMRHYASLCVIMRHYGYFASLLQVSLCVIMRHYAHYASLCVTMRHYAHYVSLCVIMCHYASICVIVRHYAKDQYASYVSLCVIMRHYALFWVIMRHYESIFWRGASNEFYYVSHNNGFYFSKNSNLNSNFFKFFSLRVCM